MHRMKRKISFKLIIAATALISLSLGLFFYLIVLRQCEAMTTEIARNALDLSETIKGSIYPALAQNKSKDIHQIIERIGKESRYEKLHIVNNHGRVAYAPNRTFLGYQERINSPDCQTCHSSKPAKHDLSAEHLTRFYYRDDGYRNLSIINPIYNEEGCGGSTCHRSVEEEPILGKVYLTLSLKDVDCTLQENKNRIIAFSVVLIVSVSLILLFLVQYLIGKPVLKLLKATEAVAEGNLDYKIEMNNDDELGHLANSFNLMTERLSEAEKQVYRQDKLASLGRLAAGVAHEINNPLTGVLTYSSFLLKRTKDNQEFQEDLTIIVNETKRCREIVKGLLDFARQVPPKKSMVSINTILDTCLSVINNQLTLSHVKLIKEYDIHLPETYADASQLQQVFINLLVNALDALDENGGEIRIRTEVKHISEEGKIYVAIGDTGCGMTPEQQNRIFDPFFTTKGQKGTGLGLAVVWGIVHEHNGSIQVRSKKNEGTTFLIHLPIEQKGLIAN